MSDRSRRLGTSGVFALLLTTAALVLGGWVQPVTTRAQEAPAAAPPSAKATGPVVPGYHHRKNARAKAEELGELLIGELNCTQCHSSDANAQRILAKGGPDLSNVGARVTPQWIREYLTDPHASKPGNTMPDVFSASEPQAKTGAVEALTHFLVSLGGPIDVAAAVSTTELAVEQGRELYHTVGCVACHAPEKTVTTKVPSVPHGNLAKKYTTKSLAEFLLDPLKARPHGRMPYLNLTSPEAEAIACYLLREQIDNPQSKNSGPARIAGLKYIFYEVIAHTAAVEKIDPLRPLKDGPIKNFTLDIPGGRRDDRFAVKFNGIVSAPRDGRYTFSVYSDDGSMLYLDGKLLVNNDSVHSGTEKSADVELKAGDHSIVVTYFEEAGGEELRVSWAGPGIEKQPIPDDALFSLGGKRMMPLASEEFRVDPQQAQLGRQMFTMLGCASCHTAGDIKSAKEYKPLAQLNPDAAGGCLSDSPGKAVPNYHFAADQRDAIKAALKKVADFAKPLEPKELVVRTMSAMNCYGCHVRDRARGQNIGGPDTARQAYFTMTGKFDMGEEGFIPPRLTGIGEKLRPEAMEQIIFEGKQHIRPIMATRMPRFSKERIGFVVDAFQKADSPTVEPPKEPEFTEALARDGRTLVGVKGGLGCVNCHSVAGNKSLGMPGPDMATIAGRIKYAWYRDLLRNPAQKNPQTRMPSFWYQGKVDYPQLAGGTPDSQIDATWSYLSLGPTMPLPSGIEVVEGGYVLTPGAEPLIHRTFMSEVGPRAILVGYPESVHVAFDANQVRLAKAWRGKFFDARGMREGRGGSHFGPLGTDIINLPAGPAFAFLNDASSPWPAMDANQRNVGGKFNGYTLDKAGQPIFRYTLNGVQVTEQPVPVLKPGGSQLIRRFTLTTGNGSPPTGLHFLAGAGAKIEDKGGGAFRIDDKVTVNLPDALKATIRNGDRGQELIAPISFDGSKATFDVEVSW